MARNLAVNQTYDRRRQQADQRGANQQAEGCTGDHITLNFFDTFYRTGNNTDGRNVGEGDQEHGQNGDGARFELGDQVFHLQHSNEFIGHNLGAHDAACGQGVMADNTSQPGYRVEQITDDILEAQADAVQENRVDHRQQGVETDQHGGHDHRHFETSHDVLAQHFYETVLGSFHLRHFVVGFIRIRVHDLQHGEGREHIEDQRQYHIARFQQGHIRTDN